VLLIWTNTNSLGLLFFFAICFGFTGGAFTSLYPVTASKIWGAAGAAALMGMLFTALIPGGVSESSGLPFLIIRLTLSNLSNPFSRHLKALGCCYRWRNDRFHGNDVSERRPKGVSLVWSETELIPFLSCHQRSRWRKGVPFLGRAAVLWVHARGFSEHPTLGPSGTREHDWTGGCDKGTQTADVEEFFGRVAESRDISCVESVSCIDTSSKF